MKIKNFQNYISRGNLKLSANSWQKNQIRLTPLLTLFAVCSLCSLSACRGHAHFGSTDDDASVEISTTGDVFIQKPYEFTTSNVMDITAKSGQIAQDENDPNKWLYYFDFEKIKDRSQKFPIMETLTYTDTYGNTKTQKVELPLLDPLMRYQWYLYNNGDNEHEKMGYSVAPLKGVDIRVVEAWNMKDSQGRNITGKDVVVAIWDSPVDLEHEDLSANMQPITVTDESGKDYFNAELPLSLVQKDYTDLHGCLVTGIISSAGMNNKGIRGVAFDSKFISTNRENYIGSLTELVQQKMDVINASFGSTILIQITDVEKILVDEIKANRVPLIHAMGNYYEDVSYDFETFKLELPNDCLKLGVNCDYRAKDSLDLKGINVGALNYDGKRAWYSSTGSSIWISGIGGDLSIVNAENLQLVNTLSHDPCSEYPKEWETQYGTIIYNVFDDYTSAWYSLIGDEEHKSLYTASMNGTSTAGPTITGIVALMKQVNPDLTVEQVKYILAKSARNDLNLTTMESKVITDPDSSLKLTSGWEDRNDNLRYSTDYGFGLADAAAAVQLTMNCQKNENCSRRETQPQQIVSTSTDCTVADNTNLGDIHVYECALGDFVQLTEDGDINPEVPFIGRMQIEGTTLSTPNLILEEDEICQFEEYYDDEQLAEKPMQYFGPITYMQLNLISPAERESIVKPYYANWTVYAKKPKNPLMTITNDFYLDEISSEDTENWKLKIYSKCVADPEKLKNFTLTIEGFQLPNT